LGKGVLAFLFLKTRFHFILLLASAKMLRRAFLIGIVLPVVLWAYPLAQTFEPIFTYLYPQIAFEKGWKASVVVVNIGRNATNVRLLAYEATGTLVQETSGGLPLDPGERRVYSKDDGAWPEGTASLKTFPLIEKEPPWWSQLALLNTGAVEAGLEIVALDSEGDPLTEGLLPILSPMAGTTVVTADLFDSSILTSTAVMQVIAGQPIAGLQLFGSEDREDVAALPAPLSLGKQLFLPVFQEGEGVPLWTMAGLINSRDGPVSITVEAFDSEHRSLGELPDLTFLSPHASHLFLTLNIGGILPSDTAFLKINADQLISGYAVIGALDGQGLTALTALTENDLASDYELIGSDDGHVLAAASLVVMSDGSAESLFGDVVPGYWKVRNGLTADTESDLIPTEILQRAGLTSRSSFAFTDDPLTSQVTVIKVIHITELRSAINTLRSQNGVSPFNFPFTDPTLTGVTIKKIHIAELRTAINEVFSAQNRKLPTFTDDPIPDGTVVKEVHIEEIRSAVRTAEIPNVLGTFVGSGSQTQTGCQDPNLNGTFSVSTVVDVSSQIGSNFSGSSTNTTTVFGFLVREDIIFSGTVTSTGALSGTLTFELFINNVLDSGGNGTFTGQVTGNTLTANTAGQDTFGDTCTFTGSLTGTRPTQ
jgi:hypothetical protein